MGACANEEFLDKGYQEASLRTIAQKAGTSTGSIYTRFGDKEGLFEAIVQPVVTGFMALVCEIQETFHGFDSETQKHPVPDDLKDTLKVAGADNVHQFFRGGQLVDISPAHSLQEFIGIFHFHLIALLGGNREWPFYLNWCAAGLAGYALRACLYALALSMSHKATFGQRGGKLAALHPVVVVRRVGEDPIRKLCVGVFSLIERLDDFNVAGGDELHGQSGKNRYHRWNSG